MISSLLPEVAGTRYFMPPSMGLLSPIAAFFPGPLRNPLDVSAGEY
jgi:hypothetical protein